MYLFLLYFILRVITVLSVYSSLQYLLTTYGYHWVLASLVQEIFLAGSWSALDARTFSLPGPLGPAYAITPE